MVDQPGEDVKPSIPKYAQSGVGRDHDHVLVPVPSSDPARAAVLAQIVPLPALALRGRAEQSFRRLDAPELFPEVAEGVVY